MFEQRGKRGIRIPAESMPKEPQEALAWVNNAILAGCEREKKIMDLEAEQDAHTIVFQKRLQTLVDAKLLKVGMAYTVPGGVLVVGYLPGAGIAATITPLTDFRATPEQTEPAKQPSGDVKTF